ncbi:MAG: hypothetical protein JWP85_2094 [Rhodoglobus sp.]|nr:hypothetical protein [Rhodoglobus sp.]
MVIATRKPTGLPTWPITLVAGAEKAGKTWIAAMAATSDLIKRTYWVGLGEDTPDEYGQVADFDIIKHDGSYREILANILEVAAEPAPADGEPATLLVVDSVSKVYRLILDNQQARANARAVAAAKRTGSDAPTVDAKFSDADWSQVRAEWAAFMDAIRAHHGPVILTARLYPAMVLDEAGNPTGVRQNRIAADSSLPFDVSAVIELPARGEAFATGVRSVRWQLPERTALPDFSMDEFWRTLGLADGPIGERTHDAPRVEVIAEETIVRDWLTDARQAPDLATANRVLAAAAVTLGKDNPTTVAIRAHVAAMTSEAARA